MSVPFLCKEKEYIIYLIPTVRIKGGEPEGSAAQGREVSLKDRLPRKGSPFLGSRSFREKPEKNEVQIK